MCVSVWVCVRKCSKGLRRERERERERERDRERERERGERERERTKDGFQAFIDRSLSVHFVLLSLLRSKAN